MPEDVFDPVAEAEALIACGRAGEAIALLSALVREGRLGIRGRILLGRAYLAHGDTAGALESLRDTASLAPHVAEAALALGEALMQAGHLPSAISEIQRALRWEPGWEEAEFLLGVAWLEAGEAKRAKDILEKLAPSEKISAKLEAARALMEAPRSPAGYVRHLFDQFAGDYDTRMLDQLSYRAHLILRELARMLLGEPAKLSVLDLGCGTGLAGEVFAPLAKGGRMDGIDLSPAMVARAKERGIYDRLILGDLEAVLAEDMGFYDLLIAADTFVYLGDLEPVLNLSQKRLKPNGLLLFTVESTSGDNFDLGPKRRYRHSEAYLRAAAAKAGLSVSGLLQCSPRSEAKVPVEGFAVALQKVG